MTTRPGNNARPILFVAEVALTQTMRVANCELQTSLPAVGCQFANRFGAEKSTRVLKKSDEPLPEMARPPRRGGRCVAVRRTTTFRQRNLRSQCTDQEVIQSAILGRRRSGDPPPSQPDEHHVTLVRVRISHLSASTGAQPPVPMTEPTCCP